MLANSSGLVPLGRAVLVQMIEMEEMKASLIAIPAHVRASSAAMETRARVIAIGDCAWEDESKPRCKVGDKVIITKMAGYVAAGPKDGQTYRLINDRDIFCLIEEEKSNE